MHRSQIHKKVAQIFVTMHWSVATYSQKMLLELRRHNYVTPTNYLELVSGYKKYDGRVRGTEGLSYIYFYEFSYTCQILTKRKYLPLLKERSHTYVHLKKHSINAFFIPILYALHSADVTYWNCSQTNESLNYIANCISLFRLSSDNLNTYTRK